MKTKSNTQTNNPMAVKEPQVEYASTLTPITSTYHKTTEQISEEWQQPLTMELIKKWNEEAEIDDETNNLLTSEQVFTVMEHKYPWLCK